MAKILSSPEIPFEQLQRATKPNLYRGQFHRLRTGLSTKLSTSNPQEAQKKVRKLEPRLALQGYTVNKSNGKWTDYVMELSRSGRKKPSKDYAYVGQTSLTPEVRLARSVLKTGTAKGRLYSKYVASI